MSLRRSSHALVTGVAFALALFLFARSVSEVFSTPLDWDESVHGVELARAEWDHNLNPLNFTHHTLSTLMSLVSTEFFGFGPASLRFPGPFFAGAFLLLFLTLGRRNLGAFTVLLLLAHYCVNEEVRHQFHSQRAYSTVLFMTLGIFLGTLDLLRAPEDSDRAKRSLLLVAILTFLSLWTHVFAGLFVGVWLLALLVWGWTVRRKTEINWTGFRRLIVVGVLASIGVLVLSYFQVQQLKEYGHVSKENYNVIGGFFQSFLSLWSFAFRWHTRPFFVALAIGIFAWIFFVRDRTEFLINRFSFCLIMTALVGFLSLVILLQAETVIRVYVWVSFLLVIALAEASRCLPTLFRFGFQAFLVALFVYMPIPYPQINPGGGMPGNLNGFFKAIRDVKAALRGVDTHCLRFGGDKPQMEFAHYIYFRVRPERVSYACEKNYLFYFSVSADTGELPGISELGKVIYIDETRSRYLVELKSQLKLGHISKIPWRLAEIKFPLDCVLGQKGPRRPFRAASGPFCPPSLP
jgi:hypothetical protein